MSEAKRARERIPVAVLGATGSVGQRFVALLADHPWFELRALTASERSAGRPYCDAVNWAQTTPLPPAFAGRVLERTEPEATEGCPIAFSALDSSIAGEAETAFARAGRLVVSNSRNHRMDPDVPLVVPEVNPDHLELVRPAAERAGRGAILTNPNCSTIGLVMALKPLVEAFGVERLHVSTLQAVSGAGLPGVPSLSILDNAIPFISGEEEKLESEPLKILGSLGEGGIESARIAISAQCNRVPVSDGHTLCVSVGLARRAEARELREAWESFSAEPQQRGLPSAPRRPIHFLDDPDAPQPRLHRDLEGGMAVSVGRLRPCPLLDFRFVALVHNTLRGAAGGALLLGELALARGLVPGHAAPRSSPG
jgi:aspartate-semialdehyde dehydrogenase